MQNLHNRTEEITAGEHLMYLTGIVSDGQQIDKRALLIISNYILGVRQGEQSFFLFDSQKKDEFKSMSSPDTEILRKFDSLQSLENVIKSLYYSNYLMTLYSKYNF